MSLVLGIDLETTGTNPSTDKILEIGCVLWDTSTNRFLKEWNVLVNDFDGEISYSPNSKLVHGITENQVKEHGYPLSRCLIILKQFFEKADYIVAHNAQFERDFIYGMPEMQCFLEKKWIDTMTDVPYPYHITVRRLEELASAHGLINYFPHQALSDVRIMIQIMARYDFGDIVRSAEFENIKLPCSAISDEEKDLVRMLGFRWAKDEKRYAVTLKPYQVEEFKARVVQLFPQAFDPMVRVISQVSYAERDKARQVGYKWDNDTRCWQKELRADQLDAELAAVRELFQVKVEYIDLSGPMTHVSFIPTPLSENASLIGSSEENHPMEMAVIEEFNSEMASYYPVDMRIYT